MLNSKSSGKNSAIGGGGSWGRRLLGCWLRSVCWLGLCCEIADRLASGGALGSGRLAAKLASRDSLLGVVWMCRNFFWGIGKGPEIMVRTGKKFKN